MSVTTSEPSKKTHVYLPRSFIRDVPPEVLFGSRELRWVVCFWQRLTALQFRVGLRFPYPSLKLKFTISKKTTMGELITAAFSASNLLLTCLLGLITLYWLSVILGAVSMDSHDVDIHHDGIDKEMPDLKDVLHMKSGVMLGVMRFFNLGRVPFMILLSILVLCMWSISVFCNHDGSWVNPENSTFIAALYLIPNFIISLFLTKTFTAPLVPIFKKLNTSEKALVIDGKVGTLMTGLKGDEIGQIKIDIGSSVVSLSVISSDGKEIKKGEKVLVIEQTEDGKAYIVQKIDHH